MTLIDLGGNTSTPNPEWLRTKALKDSVITNEEVADLLSRGMGEVAKKVIDLFGHEVPFDYPGLISDVE